MSLHGCGRLVDLYRIPRFLTSESSEQLMEDLEGFNEEFRSCFSRSEPRVNFFRHMEALLSGVGKKPLESMGPRAGSGRSRSMQRLISDVPWDEEKMLAKYSELVKEDMGSDDAVVIFGELAFPKKGGTSVGVSKQYCREFDRFENCQIGVFGAYASPHGYSLIDKRLFIPEEWFTSRFEPRKRKGKVPERLEFRSKPQLAAEMLQNLLRKDILRFKYVVATPVNWDIATLLETAEQRAGAIFFASIASHETCKVQRSDPSGETSNGVVPFKAGVVQTADKAMSADALAKTINSCFWYRYRVFEANKGFVEYEFTKKRVILYRDGLPYRTVWLVIRRSLTPKPTSSYFISNAPSGIPLKVFAWLSGIHWCIEQCFRDTRTELRMDHYEVRKYPGWHHHILACMLAHFFLWHEQIRLGKRSSVHYGLKVSDATSGDSTPPRIPRDTISRSPL